MKLGVENVSFQKVSMPTPTCQRGSLKSIAAM
jgi:hypothetical protein